MDLLKSVIYSTRSPFAHKNKKSLSAQKISHKVIFCSKISEKNLKSYLKKSHAEVNVDRLEPVASQVFQVNHGELWILQPEYFETQNETHGHNHRLSQSNYGKARDLCGSWLRIQKKVEVVEFEFYQTKDEEIVGALVGLGLASYRYLDSVRGTSLAAQWSFKKNNEKLNENLVKKAEAIFTGMNLARHLTNTPAGVATAEAIAGALKVFFKTHTNVKVDVWGVEKIKKEKMGLLYGVGMGSVCGARFVHLSYRPKLKKVKQPIAFVGKGVTFDTGGLDIKPSAGMRLMKKDMAGAALVAGLCHFISKLKLNTPCDFYLPLAENAVSDRATRPGDVHLSRSGQLVEIDNTDAEGRLVMADAIDVAVTKRGKDQPEVLIDVSTLTGAMRVAVGLDVAGFFSNTDLLAKEIEEVAQSAGEMAWRMPLVKKYNQQLSSSFADIKNSSNSGFGGAITAALFLEKFVRDTPWVHFDVMSWNNSADGAMVDGANGQCFQILTQFLLNRG